MSNFRKIGLAEGITIGIGGTIGPSMFVILGFAAGMAHSYVYLSLIIAGLLALVIALNYAELATTFPEMGGGYYYIKEGFGGFLAFFAGISLFIGYITYGAICALGFSLLLNIYVPIDPIIMATILVAAFLLINIKGVEESMRVQFVVTAILLFSFILIIYYGLIGTSSIVNRESIVSDIDGIIKAAAFLSIAYFGFEPIGVLAGAVKEPGRVIPLSIIISLLICMSLYSLIAFVATKYIPWQVLATSSTPLTLVAQQVLGGYGTLIINIAGMAATITSLNVSLSSGAFVFYSMAKDRYFPDKFIKLHPKFNTPVYALILTAFVMELFILSGMLEYITHLADFSLLIALAIVNLSTVMLRKKRKNIIRPFKVPLFPWLSIFASILTVLLAFMLELSAIVLWFGMLLAVAIIYLLNALSKERRKFTLSGFLFAVSIFLMLLYQQFRLITVSQPLKFLVGVAEIYLITQSIIVLIAAIIIIYPLLAILVRIKGRIKELVYVPPKSLWELSEAFDDILAAILFIFGALDLLLFYGILHGFISIVAPPQVLDLYKTFFLTILIISGIFEGLISIHLFTREYTIEKPE